MKRETEKILQSTPYNTYYDLFSAVFDNKASIRLSNSACRQIAGTQKPILTNFGLHFGVIPSAIITIAFSVYSANYFLLLLLVLELLFPFAIYLLKNLRIKTWYIAAIVLLVDLFFGELPVSILIITLSWLICSWAVSWWQNKIYVASIKILQYDEEAFEWAYNTHNLLIVDCYGNVYSKLRQAQSEMVAYERLLKVLKVGAGVADVDDAVTRISGYYLQKGISIPSNLYQNIAHLSRQKKCENLLNILELGAGVTGVDEITRRFIDFYKSRGVIFPDDIL